MSPARPTRHAPRGRLATIEALAAVRAALGGLALRRDLLIEHLHALQHAHGVLRQGHLVALASLLRLAPVEVFEVASFYAHFRILADAAPLPVPQRAVCSGLPCMLAGAAALPGPPAPCMGACDRAPATAAPQPRLPLPAHDYALLRAAPDAAQLLAALDTAGLRGMGGAGFPVARKWRAVQAQPGPKHLVVNADEGEPGTFKDRWCLETAPHRVLEGMLLAAQAVGAETCWIYLRDEYDALHELLARAIAEAPTALPIHLRRGAGAYICGEETALLESLEGKRGLPRHKPPFPGESGLFGRPTLIQNVETLWWLPEVLREPAAWAARGLNGAQGERLYSLSGRVALPGVKRAPCGITAQALIDQHGGGMAPGHRLRAYLPGGASGGILPAAMADIPLHFGALEPYGCFIGSAAVVVLSDQDDLAAAARNLLGFFRDESCGQCTPCRVGTAKAAQLLAPPRWDRLLLEELAQVMADGSICGLGQAAMNPVRALLRYMPEALP